MAKQGGLGDNFYVGGYDLSSDTGALSKISGSVAPLDVTGINKFGHERIGGRRDGGIDWTAFFNPSPGQAHPVLSALPTTDVICTYFNVPALGGPAASVVAKQVDYPGTRGADGSYTFAISAMANGFGLEWGNQLTAGIRTDTAATNGTAIDGLAATAFGLQAYLQTFSFTGTDVTVKLQDSADNVTFADLSGAAFTQIVAAPGSQRIAVSGTVRRYLRAVTVTTGGVTSVGFAVQATRNLTAVTF